MNTILGGSFSSRLNMNLREKNGYTYGASSGFDMRAEAGPFAAAAGVQTDKTSEALKEFFNELNGILQSVPADELARAKNYVALRFPSGFEATGDISRRLEEVLIYRLPEDYFSKYVAEHRGGHRRRRPAGGAKVHPARSVRRGGGRRPQGDRAGHPRAQSRRDQDARHRRRIRGGVRSRRQRQKDFDLYFLLPFAFCLLPFLFPRPELLREADRVHVAEHRRVRRQLRRIQEVDVEEEIACPARCRRCRRST